MYTYYIYSIYIIYIYAETGTLIRPPKRFMIWSGLQAVGSQES